MRRKIDGKGGVTGQWVPPHDVTACPLSNLQHHVLSWAFLLLDDMTLLNFNFFLPMLMIIFWT
jgi:hypothetical protein